MNKNTLLWKYFIEYLGEDITATVDADQLGKLFVEFQTNCEQFMNKLIKNLTIETEGNYENI